jgi:hypothetical protein
MPKKKATPEEAAVYQFAPNDQPQPIDRSIVFEPGQGGNTVLPSTLAGNAPEITGPQVNPQNSADGRSWVVQQVLSAEHLISLSAKLRNNASLLEPLTEQLFQHLLKVYRYKVEEILQQA